MIVKILDYSSYISLWSNTSDVSLILLHENKVKNFKKSYLIDCAGKYNMTLHLLLSFQLTGLFLSKYILMQLNSKM